MSPLSRLELLPSHIVELVVNYVADYTPSLFKELGSGSYDSEWLLQSQMPLLWVCRNFREVVYSHYYRACELEYDGELGGADTNWPDWPDCLEEFANPTLSMVKELTVNVDAWTTFNGKFLEALSRTPYSGCPLPRVRTIKIRLSSETPDEVASIRPSSIRANISDFVSRLLEMAPAADKISISGIHCEWHLPKNVQPYFLAFMLKLCQSFRHIEYKVYSGAETFSSRQIDTIRELVYLQYYIHDDCEQALQLARQNAPTLKTLIIFISCVSDILHLIQDTNGSYAQYPCLRTLELHNDVSLSFSYEMMSITPLRSKQAMTRLPAFAGATPFPGLRRLSIQIDYPFSDDVLFRGNEATLEYLDLQLSHTLIDRIRKYKVFTPDSHPKLQYVKIRQFRDDRVRNFTSTETYVQFALSIAPHAQAREIEDVPFDAKFPLFQALFEGVPDIQILELSVIRLTFWDIVSLVKSLPNLTYLYTQHPKFGRMPRGVTVKELPEYVLSKHAPVSERFRRWYIGCTSEYRPNELARCVLLLALLCPNFKYLDSVHRKDHIIFAMKTVAAKQGFREHSQRFESFLDEC
ncbi:hypothetical protein GGI10_004485 [Coemansia sp. RSA 2530]|nr:hypothetical protein GGI10_004485 [Coemansia sp. RSA 2530]